MYRVTGLCFSVSISQFFLFKSVRMGNRTAKISEFSKTTDDEDDMDTKNQETKDIVILDTREDKEVRAGCVYVVVRYNVTVDYYAHLNDRYGMGNSTKGQLGSEGSTCSPPKIIADGDLESECIVAVSGGHSMSVALTDEGYVYVWGASALSKEALKETSEEADSNDGVDHMMILSGKQDGPKQQMFSKAIPRRVLLPSSRIRISCVSAAGKHVLAVSTDGRLFSWVSRHISLTQRFFPKPYVYMYNTQGEGKDGTLGHGNRRSVNIPMGVKYLEPHFIASCATGVQHSACVTLDGCIFLWGFGLYVGSLLSVVHTRIHTHTYIYNISDTGNSEHPNERTPCFLECVNSSHHKRLQKHRLKSW